VLAVIGAIVYLGWEKPLREWLPMNKPAEVARTGAGAPTPALAAANSDQLVLRQPTSVRLKYGSATLPAGLSLHIVSKTSDAVVVDYAGEHVTIPLH
jgi:hypothetical protein